MKNLLLATSAIIAFSTASIAADLPVRSAAPAPVFVAPAFSWTGFYVGLNAGWVGSETKISEVDYGEGCYFCDPFKSKMNGFIGGLQAGYNYQIGQFVLGAEADYAWASASDTYDGSSTKNYSDRVAKHSLNSLGTVRVRVGYALDRALIYATGGFAYGRGKDYIHDTTPDELTTWSRSDWRTGWTVGGGVEYGFTNNWTAKIEALYFDLGSDTVQALYKNTDPYGMRFENTGWTVRAGVNYKFGGAAAAPVVARY